MAVAHRYAGARLLTDADHVDAVTELNEAAKGRADLLALCAGVAVSLHDHHPGEIQHLRAAQLCVDAGGDTHQIPHWIEAGRHPRLRQWARELWHPNVARESEPLLAAGPDVSLRQAAHAGAPVQADSAHPRPR